MKYYLIRYRSEYIFNDDSKNYKDEYLYVHKRFRSGAMYKDLPDGSVKTIGKVISITGRPKDFDNDDELITAWIEHIPTNELKHYSGFRGIEE